MNPQDLIAVPREILNTVEAELEKAKRAFTELREREKQIIVERDHWKAVARELKKEAVTREMELDKGKQTIAGLYESEKRVVVRYDHLEEVGKALKKEVAMRETELEKARQTIARLRESGKRAVAQRDHSEAIVKESEKELAVLRLQNTQLDHKFEDAKRAFAKLYHPNASVSARPLETMVRGEIFKEFWTELERIESQT
jgi:chromosome segregation ATPase